MGRHEKDIAMLKVLVGKRGKGEELDWEKMSAEELAMLASTPTLLGGTRMFVLRGALSGERGEEMLEHIGVFAESPHLFVLEEEKLLKGPATVLEKAGAKIDIAKTEKKDRGFDPFGLAFVLGSRDRKKLWLGIVQSLQAGEKPEAIAGLLHWKVRDLLAKGPGRAYTRSELAGLSRRLVFLYHDSHRGAGDLELLLEKFALTL